MLDVTAINAIASNFLPFGGGLCSRAGGYLSFFWDVETRRIVQDWYLSFFALCL